MSNRIDLSQVPDLIAELKRCYARIDRLSSSARSFSTRAEMYRRLWEGTLHPGMPDWAIDLEMEWTLERMNDDGFLE